MKIEKQIQKCKYDPFKSYPLQASFAHLDDEPDIQDAFFVRDLGKENWPTEPLSTLETILNH